MCWSENVQEVAQQNVDLNPVKQHLSFDWTALWGCKRTKWSLFTADAAISDIWFTLCISSPAELLQGFRYQTPLLPLSACLALFSLFSTKKNSWMVAGLLSRVGSVSFIEKAVNLHEHWAVSFYIFMVICVSCMTNTSFCHQYLSSILQ